MKKKLTKTEGFHNNADVKCAFDVTSTANDTRFWSERVSLRRIGAELTEAVVGPTEDLIVDNPIAHVAGDELSSLPGH